MKIFSDMSALVAALVLSIWLLGGCQSIQRTDPPGSQYLRSLKIEGNKLLSERQIVEPLALEESSKVPVLGEKRYFSDALLQEDKRRLIRVYESQGIYGTRIVNTSVTAKKDDVAVVIQVEEGTPVKITRLEVSGFPAEVEQPALPLTLNEVFKEADYESGKNALNDVLKDTGYPFARVEGAVVIDRAAFQAQVTYTVDPGVRYRLGAITTTGAERLDVARIVERAGLRRGDLYRASEVAAAQRRLVDLGVFAAAQISFGVAQPKTGELPLVLQVSEGQFQTVSAGGGVGFSTSRQEVRAILQYTHANFAGGLRHLQLTARPAYVWVPGFFNAERRGLGGLLRARFVQPSFLLGLDVHRLSFNASTEFERTFQDAFVEDSSKTRVGLLWPENAATTFEVGYNFEAFQLRQLPLEVTSCRKICIVSYLDMLVTNDRRDSRMAPKRGHWATLRMDIAGLGGDFRYLKVVPEARLYYDLIGDFSLALRGQIGVMLPYSDSRTPIPKRFYGGGPASHRGFGLNRLSPVVKVAGRRRKVPIGGDSINTENVELRYEILEKLTAAVFLDAGNVEEKALDFGVRELNYATGVGLRYDTPVAPLRLDVGYRLNDTIRFAQEPRYAFHLTIGDSL